MRAPAIHWKRRAVEVGSLILEIPSWARPQKRPGFTQTANLVVHTASRHRVIWLLTLSFTRFLGLKTIEEKMVDRFSSKRSATALPSSRGGHACGNRMVSAAGNGREKRRDEHPGRSVVGDVDASSKAPTHFHPPTEKEIVMAPRHHHRIRRVILAGLTGILVFPVTAAIGPTAAHADPIGLPIVGGAVDSVLGIVSGAAAGIGGALGAVLP
ncbi:MAG TPA: hypothetical protein VII47_06105 [Actinomycetota bacterium]